MIDRQSTIALPPRPGAKGGIYTENDRIIVDIQGQRFELDPVQALSLVGTVVATLEVFYRNKNNG